MRIDIDEPMAAELFWEGMREVAAGAARHQDDDLYRALVKIGRGALAPGSELVPQCGLFLQCPVCEAVAGQRCINVPGHPLSDDVLHPERVELAEMALRGDAPLPPPLRDE
ncbi:zinc finger domain-containing protein [Micromonospora chalcea]